MLMDCFSNLLAEAASTPGNVIPSLDKDTLLFTNFGSMLGRRLRRCINIELPLGECRVLTDIITA